MEKQAFSNDGYEVKSERARWPPLTRMLMSGEMSGVEPKELTLKEKFDRWCVLDLGRCWIIP